jgi:hypothetical protein
MRETQAQYKARILRHLGSRDPLPLLAAAPATLAALLARVPPGALDRRPAAGKWSIREIVAHLGDDELVGAYRVRLILSAPGTDIQAFDQDIWAVTGRYATVDPTTALTLFRVLREANLALWRSLTPAEWDLVGLHAERGPESVRDIAAYYAGHDLNHFAQIEAILAQAEPRDAPSIPRAI